MWAALRRLQWRQMCRSECDERMNSLCPGWSLWRASSERLSCSETLTPAGTTSPDTALQSIPHTDGLRVNPSSLSYPFPLSHVRVRAGSGFDRGVGVSGRVRCPLRPSIFTSLLETKGTQNTLIQIIQRVFSA